MTEIATDTKALCQQLQTIWHEQIPLSKAMQMQIKDFDGDLLTTRASLEPNVNVHGTASIVIASGQINYAKPVGEDIAVHCSFGEHLTEMEKLKSTGKGRFPLTCDVLLADGSRAGEFSGIYAVRLNR